MCIRDRSYIEGCQKDMIAALKKSGRFRAPGTFQELHSLVHGYLGDGNKMGEGWLLTAEMLELIHSGTNNIVCTQPFGCLPNHIVGKGMIRKMCIRDSLNLVLDDLPLDDVQFSGHGVHLGADHGTGLVHQVDGLVRQEAVGDIAVGQGRGGNDSPVRDLDAVVHLVPLLESPENGDSCLLYTSCRSGIRW